MRKRKISSTQPMSSSNTTKKIGMIQHCTQKEKAVMKGKEVPTMKNESQTIPK